MAELRVTHVVPALFGNRGVVGGAERYAHELARAMAQRTPTTLVSFGPASREETDGPLRIRVVGPARAVRGQASNPFAWGLWRGLGDAEVIHCHQQHVIASSASALYARLTGRTVVVSDLGGGGWDVSGYVSTDDWYHAHLHISEYSRQVFGHAHRPDARVIYGGVDLQRFGPDPAVAREPFALYVGRLLPHKGVDYLIEGLPPGLRLIVAGRVQSPAYRAQLERLAAGKDVVFRSDLDDRALVDHYRRAMCIVLPSVYRSRDGVETAVPELLGQTLLEGMACGAPAIATRVASLPEVVQDAACGLLVPPNDAAALGAALRALRDDPARAARLGAAAAERVQTHFTWTQVVDRCLDAYRQAR